MERIDQLENQVRHLSLAIRLGVAMIVAAFAFQCSVVLTRMPYFRDIFMDLLEGGPSLPILTRFFLTFAVPVTVSVVVLAVATIAVLFALPQHVWTIPVGILVAILIVAVTQLAVITVQLPLFQIVGKMSQ